MVVKKTLLRFFRVYVCSVCFYSRTGKLLKISMGCMGCTTEPGCALVSAHHIFIISVFETIECVLVFQYWCQCVCKGRRTVVIMPFEESLQENVLKVQYRLLKCCFKYLQKLFGAK